MFQLNAFALGLTDESTPLLTLLREVIWLTIFRTHEGCAHWAILFMGIKVSRYTHSNFFGQFFASRWWKRLYALISAIFIHNFPNVVIFPSIFHVHSFHCTLLLFLYSRVFLDNRLAARILPFTILNWSTKLEPTQLMLLVMKSATESMWDIFFQSRVLLDQMIPILLLKKVHAVLAISWDLFSLIAKTTKGRNILTEHLNK